jgi:predicted DNA repair protein MutK
MAASSLLALIDDIATILDDVALMTKIAAQKSAAAADDVALLTKVAAKKTAGVLGDDLALNAEQVSGVNADRELPVVFAVSKGSLVNKAILVPAALAISAVAPRAVIPLLMVGGLYLCLEGFEKVAHGLLHGGKEDEDRHAELTEALLVSGADLARVEGDKIRGAIRTDFVLSAEIIVITLGTVATAPFVQRLVVLTGVAILMTAGVYGVVAAIVKLDDLGLYLSRKGGESRLSRLRRRVGAGILGAAPFLMRLLSIAGTAAMFLVGGGILVHGIPPLYHLFEGLTGGAGVVGGLGSMLMNALAGVAAGGLALVVVEAGRRLPGRKRRLAAPSAEQAADADVDGECAPVPQAGARDDRSQKRVEGQAGGEAALEARGRGAVEGAAELDQGGQADRPAEKVGEPADRQQVPELAVGEVPAPEGVGGECAEPKRSAQGEAVDGGRRLAEGSAPAEGGEEAVGAAQGPGRRDRPGQ